VGRRCVNLRFTPEEGVDADFITCFLHNDYGLGRKLREVRTILDVGANIGFFSLAARGHYPEHNKRIFARRDRPKLVKQKKLTRTELLRQAGISRRSKCLVRRRRHQNYFIFDRPMMSPPLNPARISVIWSYWQTPRIHAGKLCKVGMPIEQISPGNLCGREAQVPGGEVSPSANGRPRPVVSSLETWLTLSLLGLGIQGTFLRRRESERPAIVQSIALSI
jgi:hypothetical protein